MSKTYVFFDAVLLGDRVPHDERLSILRFWLSPSPGEGWDLGLDIKNRSNTKMLLQISFRVADSDGFSIKNHDWNMVIAPGERLRQKIFPVTGGSKRDFRRFVISDIRVRSLSEVEWSGTSSPNQSVYEMFQLDQISLPWSQEAVLALGGIALVVVVTGMLVFMF